MSGERTSNITETLLEFADEVVDRDENDDWDDTMQELTPDEARRMLGLGVALVSWADNQLFHREAA